MFSQYAEIRRARELIASACEANGCPELAGQISVEFNSRFTRRMGDAHYLTKHIRLSGPLWPRATEDERTQTIIHEACHLIAFHKYGDAVAHSPHGRLWKRCMYMAGVEAKRCHNVDRGDLKRKTKKFAVDCGCSTHKVGPTRVRRMQSGSRYTCRNCAQPLRVDTVRRVQ